MEAHEREASQNIRGCSAGRHVSEILSMVLTSGSRDQWRRQEGGGYVLLRIHVGGGTRVC